MEDNNLLSEKKYQETEKLLTSVAIIVLVVGLCIGGLLIFNGVAKPGSSKVESLSEVLKEKKNELESRGVTFDGFTKYDDGDAYDLKVITNALDPSHNYCSRDEYKNNSITKEYCAARNSTDEYTSVVLIMSGVFICFLTCFIAAIIFSTAKRRKILAFKMQQVLPVGKEVVKDVAPFTANIAKDNIKTVSPAIADAAREITKGIKEGLKDDEK